MTMDMSMLTRLLQLNPEGVMNMSNMAAMKAAPPQIGPQAGGVLAPGAFAGVMDPTVGQVPRGVQSPLPMMQPGGMAAAPAGGGMPGGMGAGMSSAQGGVLAGLAQRQPLQFPGAAHFARPGAINATAPVGIPQGGNGPHPTLAQLLGG